MAQSIKRRTDFLESQAGIEAREILEQMVSDSSYNTASTYSSNADLYPDNLMPFIDKHMDYMCTHTELNPRLYLSNLRLMSRSRNG